jgi:hypothetical protein
LQSLLVSSLNLLWLRIGHHSIIEGGPGRKCAEYRAVGQERQSSRDPLALLYL